jgi:hypothetical protein
LKSTKLQRRRPSPFCAIRKNVTIFKPSLKGKMLRHMFIKTEYSVGVNNNMNAMTVLYSLRNYTLCY